MRLLTYFAIGSDLSENLTDFLPGKQYSFKVNFKLNKIQPTYPAVTIDLNISQSYLIKSG